MATKKSIAANAEKMGFNDASVETDSAVKFVCDMAEFSFLVNVFDEKGKKLTHKDANGNGELPDFKEYHFTRINTKDHKTGKADPNGAYSIFIVSKEAHGADYDKILARLHELMKNPMHKMFSDEDHFKKRNPEAFRIASEKSKLESVIDEKDAKIRELESKLGFNRKN